MPQQTETKMIGKFFETKRAKIDQKCKNKQSVSAKIIQKCQKK
jgi:hypothetical protein